MWRDPLSKIHDTCWRPTSFLLPSRFPTICEFKLRHIVFLPQILRPQILTLPRLQFHFNNSEISDFKYWIAGKCHLSSTSSACYFRNCRTAVGMCIFGSTLPKFHLQFLKEWEVEGLLWTSVQLGEMALLELPELKAPF